MIFLKVIVTTSNCQDLLFYVLPGTISVVRNSFPVFILSAFTLLGSFFGMVVIKIKRSRDSEKANILHIAEINNIRKQLEMRTSELANMRQAIAADFHDETGTLLSLIMHQTSLLKGKVDVELQPVVESIYDNTRQLFDTSKDFLWYLHNTGGDSLDFFDHLTAFGQNFFNQFDIAFSAEKDSNCMNTTSKLNPDTICGLMFIFKEAMNNVIKHSGADEVKLFLSHSNGKIIYSLTDNGCWKEPASSLQHYGLQNMRQRCQKNGFEFSTVIEQHRTRIEIALPVQV